MGSDLPIPRASFGSLVAEISGLCSATGEDPALDAAAVEWLHYTAEIYLTCVLSSN